MARQVRTVTVTIANGAAISAAISLVGGEHIAGVSTPSAWTAADIGFAVSKDDSTYNRLVDPTRTTAATSHARIVNVETAAARYYAVPSVLDVSHSPFVKLTSINTATNADVNQGAERSLIVHIVRD